MVLFVCRHQIVFFDLLILYINFTPLSGEPTTRETCEIHDNSQINSDEILRRRKLVEHHVLQIAEKQKQWIETYHMNYIADEITLSKKVAYNSPVLIIDAVHGKVPDIGTSGKKEELSGRDTTRCQSLNFDNKRPKTSPDHDDQFKSMASKTLPLDLEECIKRHKIVVDIIPELKNLEMNIDVDHKSFKNMDQEISSHNSDGIENIAISDEIKRCTKDISEKKFVDAPSLEVTKLNRENFENTRLNRIGSKLHIDDNGAYYCSVSNKKENFLLIINELTDFEKVKSIQYDVFPLHAIVGEKKYGASYSVYKEENIVETEFKENDNLGKTEKLSAIPEKILRPKHLKSYLSSLNKGKENWKETYHFFHKETDSKEIFKNAFSDMREESIYVSPNPTKVSPTKSDVVELVRNKERLYFHRWLKIVLNKLVNHPYAEPTNIIFSISPNSLSDLKKLSASEKYDINQVDEFISDLISNGTVNYGYSLGGLHDSFTSVGFYIIISVVLSSLLYFTLLYYPIFRMIFFILVCILWHGYKMYQERVAEKHATMTGISPAHCESILNKESGIFAHIKEFLRYNTYENHCKKYFDAIMIDPLSELSVSIVVSDFISSTFFQLFRPMGRTLNVLVKDLFFDLSFVQAFFLIVLLIFFFILFIALTLIYKRYKLNFPLFMGSVEPSIAPSGSRVEDIALDLNVKKDFVTKRIIFENYDISAIYTPECSLSSKLPPNDLQPKMFKSLMRRSSC